MKKSIVLATLLASSLLAHDENFIELGLGQKVTNSEFEYNKDSTTDKRVSEAVPVLKFGYYYDFNEDFKAYVESQQGDFNIGSKYSFNDSEIDFGLNVGIGGDEEWRNPFDKSNNNQKTDVKEAGFYLAYSQAINENLYSTVEYEYASVTYDNDEVISELKRDGKKHNLNFVNRYNDYMFNINTEIYSADGKASSYKAYNLEVGKSFDLTQRLSLMALANVGTKKYDAVNPIFGKKIDATTYGAKINLEYEKPFDYKNSYVNLTTGYNKESANHVFYDTDETYALISVGYKF